MVSEGIGAVKELAEQDRGLISGAGSDSPQAEAAAKNASKTLVEAAYFLLRRDILSGELVPGMKLRLDYLRTLYDIGASPLREALSRLVADQLVIAEEQRGFRVRPISLKDLRDITNMRQLLETTAFRQSVARGDDHWEAQVVAAYHRLSRIEERQDLGQPEILDEWEARNREFHESITAAADSLWLRHFELTLFDQADRYRRLTIKGGQSLASTARDEHRAIFEACMARDVELGCRLISEHLEHTFTRGQQTLFAGEG